MSRGCWYPARTHCGHGRSGSGSASRPHTTVKRLPSGEGSHPRGPPGTPRAPRGARRAAGKPGRARIPASAPLAAAHWPAPALQGRPTANRGRGAELRAPPDAQSRCGATRSPPELPRSLGGARDSRGRPCRSHCWEPRAGTMTPSLRRRPRRQRTGRLSGESRGAQGLWVGAGFFLGSPLTV